MIITTYEEALAMIGRPSSEIEFPEWDRTIKPTNFLRNPVSDSWAESAILDRQAHILFE